MNNGTGSNNINIGTNLIVVVLGTAALMSVSHETYPENIPTEIPKYRQLQENCWESISEVSEHPDFFKLNSLKKFSKNLLENSEDIDSDILEVVNENFWDLI